MAKPKRPISVPDDLFPGGCPPPFLVEAGVYEAPADWIDCDADPFVPEGWEVRPQDQLPGAARGKMTFDPAEAVLYLSERQEGRRTAKGTELRKELSSRPVLPANVLDWLLERPELIPESWKGQYVFFWGTVYRGRDGNLCVRYLCWYGGRWCWGDDWLGNVWHSSAPAALLIG